MHWEQERYYGLGINALVIESARNTNVIMVWAWMLWFVCTWNTNVILGHACSGYRMLWEHGRYYGLGMDALGTRTLFWFGHGCSGYLTLLEHERYDGLGMDAVVLAHTRNTNVIMFWALLEQSAWYICSIPGPRNTSRVCFVPRKPHQERSAKYAFVCVYAPAEPGTMNSLT